MERVSRKGASRSCQPNTTTAASKKEIDERRLRKLKVYLRSVSYNSCEGLPKYPTLPDLYEDTILFEEFPCDTMKLSSRQHCAPTPFLIACCFNRRYPLNARKGNIRSRPPIKQDSKKVVTSSPREKFPKQDHSKSSKAEHTSETNKNVSTSDEIEELHGNTVKREIKQKSECVKLAGQKQFETDLEIIPFQEVCTGSGKNDRECQRNCKSTCIIETDTDHNEASLSIIKECHSSDETGIEKSSCTKCLDNVSYESNASEMNELKAAKTAVDQKTERIRETTEKQQEQVWGEKEDGFVKNKCIKINKTEQELSDCLANKSRNTSSGESSVLNDHSPCQILLAKERDPIIERQETRNVTGKVSQKATVTSQKANIKPGAGHTDTYSEVENEKKPSLRRSLPKQKDEGEIVCNIVTDPSRRTSSRLATLCNRHKVQPQDKERNMQKRDVKFSEKVNLKISENSRLRSRALIKQPGHENRHSKGYQTKGK